MLLHEFDPAETAIFNPSMVFKPIEGMPKVAVSCFSFTTFDRMVALFPDAEQIAEMKCASQRFPVYKVRYKDVELALYMSWVRPCAWATRRRSTLWAWSAWCSSVPAACWTETSATAR